MKDQVHSTAPQSSGPAGGSKANAAPTDKELLELAAKAAGFKKTVWVGPQFCVICDEQTGGEPWNPLRDDYDAFRLAVKLGATVYAPEKTSSGTWVSVLVGYGPDDPDIQEAVIGDDVLAATRRAIVRAAAEIGKAKA